MSGILTVLAEFETTPQTHDSFLQACQEDSERSVADEPGCQGFTVLTPQDQADTVILYEVYDDRPAFEVHLKTPHFEKFARTVKELGIRERSVRFLSRRSS
ncbi:putative quinol monooxygenase [Gluconobacter morbifer]|nr:putative quinol monooxygenase [Gluconobacter morbifer]